MAQRPDLPVDGATISSTWGSTVRDQIVTPFTSTSQRSSEIGSPTSGMVTTLATTDSTHGLYVYNGTAWRKDWSSPWGLVARAVATGTQNLTSTSFADLSSMSASTVPLYANRYYRATLSIWVGQPIVSTTGVDATVSFRVTNGAGTAYVTLPDLFLKATDSTPYCAQGTFTASASVVTVKAQYKVSAASGTPSIIGLGTTYSSELLIEDLGPSGAPV